MEIARMAYIVYYKGKQTFNRIKRMPVNIAYRSKKMNYLIFYGDLDKQKVYFNQLKRSRGFIKLEESSSFNKELNYSL